MRKLARRALLDRLLVVVVAARDLHHLNPCHPAPDHLASARGQFEQAARVSAAFV